MEILTLDQIKTALEKIDLISTIESSFLEHSQGCCIMPQPGELLFDNPPGDAHIKYGYFKNSDYYVIKIASGFYQNNILGIDNNQGMMLIFSKQTGQPVCLLKDDCYLTNVRTAVAGAIASKYFQPKNINHIGIVGTGTQAKMQLSYLEDVIKTRDVIVYGRQPQKLKAFKSSFKDKPFRITTTTDIHTLCQQCNYIVTTTPSEQPLLYHDMLLPNTHITAIGSDTPIKQELDTDILQKADLVITDSIEQAQFRGEITHAIKARKLTIDDVTEMGKLIQSPDNNSNNLSIADFTGVAALDISVALAVFNESRS